MLNFTRVGCRLLAGAIAAASFYFAPVGVGPTPAQAQQVQVSVEFQNALEPYGRWRRHSRWGDVWIPANVQRDWRPYTRGHWVYTDDWGWYWVEDDAEASWGWVTNHYGRWVYDDELEWCWVPGEEWGPAWVQWRRSDDVVGWAALPPDDVVVEYRQSPRFWVFVRARDFVAPRIANVIVSEREYPAFFHETVVVNRTVVVGDRGSRFAVNPGIPAAFIAARVGRPLRTFEVRPRVLAGTAQIPNAVVVREQDLRRGESFRTQTIRETRSEIRPSQQVPPPRALGANEQGRLGDNPPRAASRGQQGPTEGRGGEQQGVDRGNRGESNQRGATRGEQRPQPGIEGRGREPRQLPGTEGRGRGEPKQQPGTEGRGEPRPQMNAPRPQMNTEGRGRNEPRPQMNAPRPQMNTEGRGRGEPRPQMNAPRPQMNTEGRGRGEPRPQMNAPRPQMNTEGRGRSEPRPLSTDGRGGAGQEPRGMNRGGGEIRQAPPPRTEGRGGGAPPRAAAPAQGPGRGGPGEGRPQRQER